MNFRLHLKYAALVCATSALPFIAHAQEPAPAAAPAQQPAVAAPEPGPLPPPLWSPQDSQELLAFIEAIGG